MSRVPQSRSEPERLARVLECGFVETSLESNFNDLANLAASICAAPGAMVLLESSGQQLGISAGGSFIQQFRQDPTFEALFQPDAGPLVIHDLRLDHRTRGSRLLSGESPILAYAGIPLGPFDHPERGVLCVVDFRPREFSSLEVDHLNRLARLASSQLEMHRRNRRFSESVIAANRQCDLLGTLIDNIDDALTVKDCEGRYILFNRSASRLMNRSPVQVLGTNDFEHHSEDVAHQLRRSDLRVMESCQPETTEESVVTCGEPRTFQVTKSPYINRGGLVSGVISVSREITDRVRALQAVRHNEERFRKLVENAWDASVVLDQEGRVIFATQSIERILGLQPCDLVGQQGLDFIHADDTDRAQKELLLLTARPERPRVVRHRIVLPGGGVRWLEMVLTNLLSDPELQGIVVNVRDVTAQHRIVQELRERDALLRKLSEQVPGVIYQFRQYPDGRRSFPYASEGIRQIYEVSPEQVRESADPVFAILHPDDFDLVVTSIRRSFETMQPWHAEYRVKLPIQGVQWREGHSVPERMEDGSILWHGYICDVTDRKQAEVNLRASQERLQAIFDSEPECVKLIDRNCRLQDMNPAGLRMIEAASLDQVRHHCVLDLVPPEYRDTYRQGVEQVFSGQSTRMEFEIIGLNGTRRWMEQYAVGIRDPQNPGCVSQMLAVTRDVTDRRQSEMELAQARLNAEAASKAKSEFLANMSHEIRTPLTAILGYANLLTDELAHEITPDRRAAAIATIRHGGEHLLTVVNDILDLSKIEAGQMVVERIDTNIIELIRSVDALMRPRAESRGLQLAIACNTPLPLRILTDPTRLRQILINLLGNAIKFTIQGSVSVRFEVVESLTSPCLQFTVEDTGIGMTPQQSERLFAAFAQGDSTVTRRYGGTGLGLVISQRLARLLGGDVRLQQTELGRGSTFIASIAIEPVGGTTLAEDLLTSDLQDFRAISVQSAILNGRILLAEDARENQVLISFLLRRAGADVEIAENGLVALEMIRAAASQGNPYDLLLTDMQMPEMDGYSLTRELRGQGMKLPIIALTAHAMAEDRQKCTNAGCDDYASKPVDKATLLSICARWMGQKNEARHLATID